jgi:hypothetical protein
MSTIDPVAVRLARRNRRPGNARVVIALVLQFAGGLGMGYGWLSLFGATMFEGEDTFEPAASSLVGVIGGLPVAIIGSILWMGIIMKRPELGIFFGWSAFWLGGGIGVALAARGVGQPYLLTVIAIACIALAVLFLGFGVWASRRRSTAKRREADIMRTGIPTTATVSDRGYTVFHESNRILTNVTFTFTDPQGVQRWVQRPVLIRAEDPVVNGQETRIWYDRTNPGDDKRIVVELAVQSPWR